MDWVEVLKWIIRYRFLIIFLTIILYRYNSSIIEGS